MSRIRAFLLLVICASVFVVTAQTGYAHENHHRHDAHEVNQQSAQGFLVEIQAEDPVLYKMVKNGNFSLKMQEDRSRGPCLLCSCTPVGHIALCIYAPWQWDCWTHALTPCAGLPCATEADCQGL